MALYITRTIRPTFWFYLVAFIEFVCSVGLAALHYPRMDEPLGLGMYILFVCVSAAILLIMVLTLFPRAFGFFYSIFFRMDVDMNRYGGEGGGSGVHANPGLTGDSDLL